MGFILVAAMTQRLVSMLPVATCISIAAGRPTEWVLLEGPAQSKTEKGLEQEATEFTKSVAELYAKT